MNWTKEYCGVQHLGECSLRKVWVTVERHSKVATLLRWFPGCKFSPTETDYPTVEIAKRAGEAIMLES